MSDTVRSKKPRPQRLGFLRVPLFRLLAINLAAGMAVAALLVGGLLVLDPYHLRDLIFAELIAGHCARAAAVRVRRDVWIGGDGDRDHGSGATAGG